MAEMDMELGWDDEITCRTDTFIELPPGDYDFTIDRYERSYFNGSEKVRASTMVIVYFNVRTPDGQETQIRDSYILLKSFEKKISQLFAGVGLMKEGETKKMNWPAIPGLSGRAEISLDPDRKDPSKKYNHIKGIYPKEDTGSKPVNYKAGVF